MNDVVSSLCTWAVKYICSSSNLWSWVDEIHLWLIETTKKWQFNELKGSEWRKVTILRHWVLCWNPWAKQHGRAGQDRPRVIAFNVDSTKIIKKWKASDRDVFPLCGFLVCLSCHHSGAVLFPKVVSLSPWVLTNCGIFGRLSPHHHTFGKYTWGVCISQYSFTAAEFVVGVEILVAQPQNLRLYQYSTIPFHWMPFGDKLGSVWGVQAEWVVQLWGRSGVVGWSRGRATSLARGWLSQHRHGCVF